MILKTVDKILKDKKVAIQRFRVASRANITKRPNNALIKLK